MIFYIILCLLQFKYDCLSIERTTPSTRLPAKGSLSNTNARAALWRLVRAKGSRPPAGGPTGRVGRYERCLRGRICRRQRAGSVRSSSAMLTEPSRLTQPEPTGCQPTSGAPSGGRRQTTWVGWRDLPLRGFSEGGVDVDVVGLDIVFPFVGCALVASFTKGQEDRKRPPEIRRPSPGHNGRPSPVTASPRSAKPRPAHLLQPQGPAGASARRVGVVKPREQVASRSKSLYHVTRKQHMTPRLCNMEVSSLGTHRPSAPEPYLKERASC